MLTKRRGRRSGPRNIGFEPESLCYKPCGKRGNRLERVALGHDEMEALRLSDYEGLYQEEAALRMGISRSTFSRIVTEARRKVADALLHGKVIMIKEFEKSLKPDKTDEGETP